MNIGENLKEKKIILTGGSRGIGLSILEKLYSYNSKVLIVGSNNENLLIAKEKYPNMELAITLDIAWEKVLNEYKTKDETGKTDITSLPS